MAAVVTALALYTSIELALNGYSDAAAISFFYEVGMFLLKPLALSVVSSTLWFLSGFFGNPLAIITVVWDILDAIFGWTGDWMQDVIDWFSSEWDSYLVIPDAWMEETTLNIDDYDDNGLDVGDRVELKSRAIGKIGLTGESLVSYPWIDICSWIDLTYSYSVPPGSGSNGSIYRPDPPGPCG